MVSGNGGDRNGKYLYVAVLVISSLLNAIYFSASSSGCLWIRPKSWVISIWIIPGESGTPWNMLIPIGVCGRSHRHWIVSKLYLDGILKTTLLEVFKDYDYIAFARL